MESPMIIFLLILATLAVILLGAAVDGLHRLCHIFEQLEEEAERDLK
jgi:hypothetical protein